MVWKILMLILLASAVFGRGLESHAPTQELLSRNPIRLTGSGRAEISFVDAASILQRDDLLAAIQRSYAAVLPEGEAPEFTVTQTGPGAYHYTNRHGQETRIEEVLNETEAGERVEVAMYSEGDRFFGPYQSLCIVEVVPAGTNRVDYTVRVYARPESAAVRLFARITPVELYFRHKLKEMTGLVIDVCTHMKQTEIEKGCHVVSSF